MGDNRAYFVQAVERDKALWQSLDVRLLAVYVDGLWRNLCTQVYLRPTTPEDTPRLSHPVRGSVLRAEQHILPFSELAPVLDSIEQGNWLKGSDAVAFMSRQFESSAPTPYAFMYSQFHSLD